jgi:hypothetical protein
MHFTTMRASMKMFISILALAACAAALPQPNSMGGNNAKYPLVKGPLSFPLVMGIIHSVQLVVVSKKVGRFWPFRSGNP